MIILVFKPRTDEQFLHDKFLDKFILIFSRVYDDEHFFLDGRTHEHIKFVKEKLLDCMGLY